MTGNRADADDLAQEAVARAIERADQVAEADASGWLFQVTTRLCLDHLPIVEQRHREHRADDGTRSPRTRPACEKVRISA